MRLLLLIGCKEYMRPILCVQHPFQLSDFHHLTFYLTYALIFYRAIYLTCIPSLSLSLSDIRSGILYGMCAGPGVPSC